MRASRALPLAGLVLLACTDPVGPSRGALTISLSVVGMDGDTDGYGFSIDGRHEVLLSGPGSTTIDLGDGRHTVAIGGMVPNCSPTGGSTQQVSVSPSDTARVSFVVECRAVTGVIEVAITTSGHDPDADGYLLRLNGGAPHNVYRTTVRRFAGVSPGMHTLLLENVAANCATAGPNPLTGIQVTAGGLVRDTTHVAFDIACAAVTGAIKIVTRTTGLPDPNGYLVSVLPGMQVPRRMGANDSLVVWGLPPGVANLAFQDLAPACAPVGSLPRVAAVEVGDTTEVGVAIHCTGPGTVRVTTTTSGAGQDTSYTITLDGEALRPATGNGVELFDALAGGHTVGLDSVALNCSVAGANPASVTVVEGDTTDVAFNVTCVTPGTVRVTAALSGPSPDPAFLVTVDGVTRGLLLADSMATFDLTPGSHSIGLADVAGNCTVSGSNPVTVDVTAGTTSDVAFTVVCVQPPRTGVDVVVTTTGTNLDTSYLLRLCDIYYYCYGGYWGGSLPANGTVSIDLPASRYWWDLWDVSANCRTTTSGYLDVTDMQVTTLRIDVTCADAAVARIFTPTTGPAPAGSFAVSMDGTVWTSLPLNGVAIVDTYAGSHTFELHGLPFNCAVSGGNPRVVDLAPGVTTDVPFNVVCTTPAAINVTVSAGGTDPDPYVVVLLDGAPVEWISTPGTATIQVLPGTYSVDLGDLEANCTVTSQHPVTVTAVSGAVHSVNFTLDCVPNPTLRVSTTTTGTNIPAGFLVGVDADYYYGYRWVANIAPSGSVSMRLPVGTHTVTLDNVPPNCTVTSPNNVAVSMALNTTTDVLFTVTCQ